MVERSAADHLPVSASSAASASRRPASASFGSSTEVGDELVAVERRQIAGLAELGVAECGQDPVDVLEPWGAQQDLACADARRGN